jgi:hypothetical protein
MKRIEINCVVFAYSCLRTCGPHPQPLIDSIDEFLSKEGVFLLVLNDAPQVATRGVIDSLGLAGRRTVAVCEGDKRDWTLVCPSGNTRTLLGRSSLESIVSQLLNSRDISPQSTISIGCADAHLSLSRCSLLHFHVGALSSLKRQIRGLIPLTGQYEAGVSNVFKYFTSADLADDAIEYSDLITFVSRARGFFRGDAAASVLLRKHISASSDLAGRFPDDIAAIFGTGFPFYLIEEGLVIADCNTPESILAYFDEQLEYFQRKVLAENVFDDRSAEVFNTGEMADRFGVQVGRNEFDLYEYQRMGYPVPVVEKPESDLQGYYNRTCFSITSDIWPCYYCATLQSRDKFPHQLEAMNSNVTCLPCKQTSFMLRNVMSSSPDIDVVVVVRENKETSAEAIRDYILRESPYHIYDSDFHRTVFNNDGPIDLFVTELADILPALRDVNTCNWFDVTFDSVALWSPSVQYKAQFGLCFPLAFEPVLMKDDVLWRELTSSRRMFARQHSSQDILSELSRASFYTRQLVSSANVVRILEARLLRWRQIPEE